MSLRIALPVFVFAGIVPGTFACSGQVVGQGSTVTNLPDTDPVTRDGAQFCSDVVTYFEGLVPSLAGLTCANEIEADESIDTGGGPITMTTPACQMEYEACVTAISSVDVDASAVKSDTASLFSGCSTSIMKCNGATVAQVSACVSDLANAIVEVSRGVTEAAVCSAHPPSYKFPNEPASCASLPKDCLFSSSVSVSSGGSGSSGSGGGSSGSSGGGTGK